MVYHAQTASWVTLQLKLPCGAWTRRNSHTPKCQEPAATRKPGLLIKLRSRLEVGKELPLNFLTKDIWKLLAVDAMQFSLLTLPGNLLTKTKVLGPKSSLYYSFRVNHTTQDSFPTSWMARHYSRALVSE